MQQSTARTYESNVDRRTLTPGVYQRGSYYRVLTRPDGKRKVMRRFETYEEAVAFKATQPNHGGRPTGRGASDVSFRATSRAADVFRSDPCSYCNGPADSIDHIEPVSAGGLDDWNNLTASCRSCNTAKGPKPLLLFLAHRNGCFEWRRDRA